LLVLSDLALSNFHPGVTKDLFCLTFQFLIFGKIQVISCIILPDTNEI